MLHGAPEALERPPHQRSGRARVFDLLEANASGDPVSKAVDATIVALIVLALSSVLLSTVDSVQASIGWLLDTVLVVAVLAFTAEYALRLWSCTCEPAYADPVEGRIRFALTPLALVDALALAPFYIALVANVVTFGSAELAPVIQLFLLLLFLKLARYSRALRTLGRVLHARRGELLAVLVVDLVLLVAVSSAMYFVEGDVQPQAFSSIPETMWWGLVTMTTVGYGDVTPVTHGGRVIAGIASLLGVAMFALPAGVLGAGFTEAFQKASEKTRAPHESEWGSTDR
jgi:voltage-gated potassium channel